MKNVSVTYLDTVITEIKDYTKLSDYIETTHYVYAYPVLDVDADKQSAVFKVIISSQFEAATLPYRISTSSEFIFENFVADEDKYVLLDDCSAFAYKKHLEILKGNLIDKRYDEKINETFKMFTKNFDIQNPLDMVLSRAMLDSQPA